jgi:DNA-binding CsgD family transcriptional regulator
MAAVFFVADAIGDISDDGFGAHVVVEGGAALGLLAGVLLGAWQVRALVIRARSDEAAVATARGALAELIRLRFAEWRLTPAESDVALFALKGCDVAEIARLRGAAQGTVRAQLTRVYAKAGTASQAGLIAAFVEELVDPNMMAADQGQ